MPTIPKGITIAYFMLLGITLGAGLYAGIVVAPVIFHAELYLGAPLLSRFQEGLIMTENFIRLGYLVDFTVLAVALYEGFKYKNFDRDITTTVSALLVLASGLLYMHYYIPQILELQKKGESVTQSELFENTHFASELDFKLFALALTVLLARNLYRTLK
ncbi:MAG TPA: DUF4149 domain-containing protein [Campylobacteraceae bacterium]|nr:DUF4149 domain-containing protein [Campylobacteraceae bacterium]